MVNPFNNNGFLNCLPLQRMAGILLIPKKVGLQMTMH